MAYLNMQGLTSLWNKISEVFARKTKAAASLVLSGTSLVMSAVSGDQLASVDLGGTFATDAEAAHSLSSTDFTLSLKNVNGTQLSSVALTSQARAALDPRYGARLSRDGRTITLVAKDGSTLNSVTVPDTDLTDYATKTYVGTHAITQVIYEGRSNNTITLGFYDNYGTQLDTVSFYVGDI